MTTQETHPIVDLTDEALQTMLRRALWITLVLGFLCRLRCADRIELAQWRHAAYRRGHFRCEHS